MPISLAELLKHKIVLSAIAVVALILIGSVAYYVIETRPPGLSYVPVTTGSITEDVLGTGSVTPVENPDLSFATGGKVADVNVAVGDTVQAGELLASLDTGILAANLASAEANYAGVSAPPRAVDVAGKQTAVDQANTTVANAYAALPSVIANAVAESEDAVHATDFLFGSFNVVDYPRVNFLTGSDQAADQAGRDRGALQNAFDSWNQDVETLSSGENESDLDTALSTTIDRLTQIRTFFDDLAEAVQDANPALPASEVATVTGGRSTVNSLILSLQGEVQTIASDKLAVESAENALNLLQAGATPEAVSAAKAQVDAAQAALSQAEIVAPFSGTVAAVSVKPGDIATPNAPAISLLPGSNFEVEVYLSEIDAAKIAAGDTADITLDAYGPGTVFPATVASVDRASTMENGVSAYKATISFNAQDPKLAAGLGANVVIHAGEKDDTLLVPAGAVVTENNQTYVLKQSPNGPVKTPVVTGLLGATTTEIISGVSAGDEVARVAGS